MKGPVYIVAGTHRHAQMLAEEIGVPPAHWRYVGDSSRLRGIARGSLVFVLETAIDLPELFEIEELIAIYHLQRLQVSLDRIKGVYR